MACYLSSNLEMDDALQKMMIAQRDSTPKKKIPKKYKLPRGHYTKEYLLENHQITLDESFKYKTTPLRTTQDPISCSKVTVFGKQDLKKYENSYTPIKIRDLTPGVVNRERIVYAKIIVEVAIWASIHTVIEDESKDGGSCKLCVYNVPEENRYQFDKGTKLAILNPYYKKRINVINFMRIDNPMEIIVIQAPGGLGDTPSLLPIQHKELGNKLVREERFAEALEAYTHAIMGDRREPIFYSNRSLCHTRLGQFEAAMSDAMTASEMNLDESKFKYRACMALSGLGDHQKSVEILEQLVHSAQNNNNMIEFQDKLTVEKAFLVQAGGDIDLRRLEQIALAGLSVQMADFIGPIELKQSGMTGCAERGLFATRDLRQGEVIHVSKAAAYLNNFVTGMSDPIEISSDAMSPPFLILVSKLIQKMNKSRLFTYRVLNIVEDEKFSKKSPFYTNIGLYGCKGYDLIQDFPSPEFSVENIRYAAHRKGMGSIVNGSNNLCFSGGSGPMDFALWLIPSLLNHSCIGNVVRVVKKEICVLKVFKDVRKGEELLMSYFEGGFFMNLNERKKSLKKRYDYMCNCVLCKYEKEPNIAPLLAKVSVLFDQVRGLWKRHACTRTKPPRDEYREYVTRGIELAEGLGLGPQTFCGTLWSTFLDLASIFKAEMEDQSFLYEKTQKYLSHLEVYHQFSYWEFYRDFCLKYFGKLDRRTMQASSNFNKFDRIFLWKN